MWTKGKEEETAANYAFFEREYQVTDIACVGRVLAKNSCFGEGHRKKRHAVCGLKTTGQTTGQKHKQPVSRHRFFIVLSSFCHRFFSFVTTEKGGLKSMESFDGGR